MIFEPRARHERGANLIEVVLFSVLAGVVLVDTACIIALVCCVK